MQDSKDLLRDSYDYDLPESMIATRPASPRDHSKLLVYNNKTSEIVHTHFYELSKYLPVKTLLVFNESKVFPCRLYGQKKTGGKAELFLLSLIPHHGGYECLIRARGKKEVSDIFLFDGMEATIIDILEGGSFLVSFNISHEELLNLIDRVGNIPIPPYIRGGLSDEKDKEDYQTIYAKDSGSVAAPTAGLHFTKEVFKSLDDRGIKKDFITLHVGAGTFKTVDCDSILDHVMHEELYSISEKTASNLNENYGNIIAVGTTTLRTLESSFDKKTSKFHGGELLGTKIFLYPGVPVNSVKGLITNFHLPKSTLLMLVSSLIGREKTLELYEIAKKENYRFFSYGDSMLILR